jgi:hypothetical protein
MNIEELTIRKIALPEAHAEEEKPLPGWMCVGLGVGFIALLGALLVAVRVLSP